MFLRNDRRLSVLTQITTEMAEQYFVLFSYISFRLSLPVSRRYKQTKWQMGKFHILTNKSKYSTLILVFGPCIFIIEEKNKPTKCTN